jgi:hypothetical protein
MLQKFVNLIALVQTIIALPPDDYDEVNAKVQEYEAAKQDIKTFHGDSELAHAQVVGELDKLVKTARAATVDLNEVDSIVQEQDDNKPEEGDETAEDLVAKNSAAQLRELAAKEEVEIAGLTTKDDIAAAIIKKRNAAQG